MNLRKNSYIIQRNSMKNNNKRTTLKIRKLPNIEVNQGFNSQIQNKTMNIINPNHSFSNNQIINSLNQSQKINYQNPGNININNNGNIIYNIKYLKNFINYPPVQTNDDTTKRQKLFGFSPLQNYSTSSRSTRKGMIINYINNIPTNLNLNQYGNLNYTMTQKNNFFRYPQMNNIIFK